MKKIISACIDSNVIISAIAFGGIPFKILDRALTRDFHLVLGPPIILESRGNLISKLDLDPDEVDIVLNDLIDVASIFVPTGKERFISHEKDNLVLEIALMANCDVLVTGDKKHLLPLSPFNNLLIEPPSKFNLRFEDNSRSVEQKNDS